MKQFALIGDPLGHSLSPSLHKAIYRQLEIDDASYRAIELNQDKLSGFFQGMRAGGFDGVNVTIPHKSAVIDALDDIDPPARLLNAVNCIHQVHGTLVGYNTDVLGFAHSLASNQIDIEGNVFAILGAGGSAQAVAAVLAQGNAQTVYLVNRSQQRAQALSGLIQSMNAQVSAIVCEADALNEVGSTLSGIVNTTPVGMSPAITESPLTLNKAIAHDGLAVVDLIYNPSQTQLLQEAESLGAKAINGMEMLVAPAVYSVEIWLGGNVVSHVDMSSLVRELERRLVQKSG